MSKVRSYGINRTVVAVVVCTAAALVGFSLRNNRAAAAKANRPQRSDDKLLLRHDFGAEPVQFSRFRVKNVTIAPGMKFSAKALADAAGEDWLESFGFNLKNVSDKRIAYVSLQFHFPETGNSGARMVYNLDVGIPPKALASPSENAEPLSLDPGDTFTFTLSTKELQHIKSFLEREKYRLVDLNQLDIILGPVVFDDGLKWEMRHMYRPNPNVPSGYEIIK
jgi:hypothetical protein